MDFPDLRDGIRRILAKSPAIEGAKVPTVTHVDSYSPPNVSVR
jgi:hypothetical protein